MTAAFLYVPKRGTMAPIAQGSAIVGLPMTMPDGSVLGVTIEVRYEGNTIGAANLQRFVEKAKRAFDHLRYPTSSRMHVADDALILIGVYDDTLGKVRLFQDTLREFCAWVNDPHIATYYIPSEQLTLK